MLQLLKNYHLDKFFKQLVDIGVEGPTDLKFIDDEDMSKFEFKPNELTKFLQMLKSVGCEENL